MDTTKLQARVSHIKSLIVNKRWREINQELSKTLRKRLVQSIPKRFLAFIHAISRQMRRITIPIINEF